MPEKKNSFTRKTEHTESKCQAKTKKSLVEDREIKVRAQKIP